MSISSETQSPQQHRFFHSLYFRVIVGIILGVALGAFYPSLGEQMKFSLQVYQQKSMRLIFLAYFRLTFK